MKRLLLSLICALACISALGQTPAAPISGRATDQFGNPIPYAQIRVCSVTSTGIPCNITSPPVTVYLDYALTTPISDPFSADQYGNFLAYVPALSFPNLYVIQESANQGLTWSYVQPGPPNGTYILPPLTPTILGGVKGTGTSLVCSSGQWLNGFNSDGSYNCVTVPGTSLGVQHNGTLVGTQPAINLIDGTNTTLTVSNDSGNNRVNITIASTGGGTGCGPLAGDNTSTLCGENSLVGATGTEQSVFGYTEGNGNSALDVTLVGTGNGDGNNAARDVILAGQDNLPNGASSTSSEIVSVADSGLQNLNPTSHSYDIDVSGDSPLSSGDANSLTYARDVVAHGDIPFGIYSGQTMSLDTVIGIGLSPCSGEAPQTGANYNISETICMGNGAADGIDGADNICIGDGVCGNSSSTKATVNDLDCTGDGSCGQMGNGSSDIVGHGDGACAYLGVNSSDAVCLGDGATVVSGLHGSTVTNVIAIQGQLTAASNQTVIGNSNMTSLLLFGCPAGETVYDDGSGTCYTPSGGGITGIDVNGSPVTPTAGVVNYAAGTNITLTPSGNTITITSSATAATAFSALTTATNSTAAMTVGTGASLGTSGSGTIAATTASSAAKWTTARNLAGNSTDGSANVAFANKFIVQGTTDSGLSGAQFLGALATGLVKNTTSTGVLSIATAGTDYVIPSGSITGNAGTATALASAPSTCSAGHYPLGVDVNGNAVSCTAAAGATPSFSTLSSGTNTTAAMLVGTGASLAATGSGSITATSMPYSGLTGSAPTWNQSTTGNAGTATALAATPAQCTSGQYSTGITAAGVANCAQVAYSQLSGTPSIPITEIDNATVAVTPSSGKINFAPGSNVTLTTSGNTITITASSTAATAFSALTSATNTSAAMVVGTGASLGVSGSGTIAATTATSFTGSLTGDVTGTQSATVVGKVNGGSIPASAALVGTNSSSQFTTVTTIPTSTVPAFTGDAHNSAGSLAMTVSAINGTTVPTSAPLLGTNGSAQPISVTVLPTSAVPAFTGDATNTAGSLALTVKKINGVALSGLATGILKNTTTTGVPSIAVASDVVSLFSSCSGTQYLGADWACHTATGTPGSTTGAIQYNNAGTLGGVVITGLVKGNGASAPTAAVAGTDYLLPTGSGASLTGITPAQVGSPTKVASGSSSLNTSSIASLGCNTTTITAAGVLATDTVVWSTSGSITGVTGYIPSSSGGLAIYPAYASSGAINFPVCNWSSNPVTPGVVTVQWIDER